jgi:DNA-binding transcriptional LysR family regulator
MAHLEHPSIEELRALAAVAETGTETEAAQRLGISQPVVNRRLRQFRQTPALVRTVDNAVELTPAGQEALPAIQRLLRQYDHLRQILAGRPGRPNRLVIGAGSSATQYYLGRAVAALRGRLPDWEIQTRVLRGKDRVAGVVEGTLDVSLVSHNRVQIESIARWACAARAELEISELARLPLCVLARRQTPEGEQLQAVLAAHAVPPTMLSDWPLAGLDSDSGVRRQLEALLGGGSRRLPFTVEAGGWLGVKEFVRQGLCAGLLPLALLWPDDAKQFVIRRLPDELSIAHRVVCRQDGETELLAEVKAALRAAAEEFQQEVKRRWSGAL